MGNIPFEINEMTNLGWNKNNGIKMNLLLILKNG